MFALPVRSQVFTGRVVCAPPRLAFVSYHALGLHRGLAKAKMFFSFSLMVCVCVCIVVSLYIGIGVQFLFGFIAQSCTAINDVTSC